MQTALSASSSKQSAKPAELTFGKAAEVLWDCAWEALVLAFLVLWVGSIAMGLAGAVWREMIPSPPPGLAGGTTALSPVWNNLRALVGQHQFAILFSILFIGKSTAGLIQYSRHPAPRDAAAWLRRICRRISAEWFSLIVMNAFVAMVGALVLKWVQNFSLTQLFWHWFLNWFSPVIQMLINVLPGGGMLKNLAQWYGDNQLKFTFWLLYSAAICDDLGLPNLKTLGRLIWCKLSQEPIRRPTTMTDSK